MLRAASITTIPAHSAQIYTATFSPHSPHIIATCAADGLLKLFDIRSNREAQAFAATDCEVLSADWNKYDNLSIATAGKDRAIRLWDLRSGVRPAGELSGHDLAVRKVQYVSLCPIERI